MDELQLRVLFSLAWFVVMKEDPTNYPVCLLYMATIQRSNTIFQNRTRLFRTSSYKNEDWNTESLGMSFHMSSNKSCTFGISARYDD